MKNARLLLPIALLLIAGCAGSKSVPAPRVSVASIAPQPANVSVRFLWPTKSTTASGRQASYISPATDHIKVFTSNGYATLAASDQSVSIPFGTPSATIPAYVGYNYWYFYEYDSPQETLLLASANAYQYISDPAIAVTLDVVLQMNISTMGVSVGATGLPIYSTSSLTPSTPGAIKLYSTYSTAGATFTVYVAAADAHANVATGAGVPGVTLTTTDSRISIARAPSATTGAYAGQVAYTFTLLTTILTTDPPIVINAYGIGTNYYSQTQSVGQINVTVPAL